MSRPFGKKNVPNVAVILMQNNLKMPQNVPCVFQNHQFVEMVALKLLFVFVDLLMLTW